jgi:hypothetical protein
MHHMYASLHMLDMQIRNCSQHIIASEKKLAQQQVCPKLHIQNVQLNLDNTGRKSVACSTISSAHIALVLLCRGSLYEKQ